MKATRLIILIALVFVLTTPIVVQAKKVPMKEYEYKIPERFVSLNKKVNNALQTGKRRKIKTGLSFDECLYYRNVLLYNTTVLQYAISRTRDTIDFLEPDEKEYVILKQADRYCYFIIDGKRLTSLVDEAKKNKAEAKKIINKLDITSNTEQKFAVGLIYRYIFEECEYDIDKRGASDAMKGRGNCAAMSSEFRLLCRLIGLPCEYVRGNTTDSAHAWNRVKIDGAWYYIDNALYLKASKQLWKTHVKIITKY